MKINQKMQKVILFLKTDTGRLWVKRTILFIIILLGLRWAIATGVRKGAEALWDIEKALCDIREEIAELHQSYLINSATSQR